MMYFDDVGHVGDVASEQVRVDTERVGAAERGVTDAVGQPRLPRRFQVPDLIGVRITAPC